jgi:hypothetical protein
MARQDARSYAVDGSQSRYRFDIIIIYYSARYRGSFTFDTEAGVFRGVSKVFSMRNYCHNSQRQPGQKSLAFYIGAGGNSWYAYPEKCPLGLLFLRKFGIDFDRFCFLEFKFENALRVFGEFTSSQTLIAISRSYINTRDVF